MKRSELMGTLFRVFLMLMVFGFQSEAGAQIPHTINYQGYLRDTAGVPVDTAEGTIDMRFSLYTSAEDGSALWTDTLSVTVAQGVYNVTLGPFGPSVPFDSEYFLEVEIDEGAGSFVTLGPRQPLSAVPYALNSESAVSIVDNAVTSNSIAAGSVTADKLAPGVLPDGHSLDASDGGPTEAVYVDADGNVGIGTTTPATELDVTGTVTADGIDVSGPIDMEGTTGTQNYTYYTYTKGVDVDINCSGWAGNRCDHCDTTVTGHDCPTVFSTLTYDSTYCYDQYYVPFDCWATRYDLTSTNNVTATNPRSVHVTDTGSLGIGTDNPLGKLHVEDVIYDRGLLGCPAGYASGDFDGEADETDCKAIAIVASVNGLVGIGTANPSAKLDVEGSVRTTGQVTSSGLDVTGEAHIQGDVIAQGTIQATRYVGNEMEIAGPVAADSIEVSGGIINDFAIIEGRKAPGTDGGSMTAHAWTTRELNHVVSNGASIKLCTASGTPEAECSGANGIWLAAGTYLVEGRAPGMEVDRHRAFFYNRSDPDLTIYGSSAYSSQSYHGQTDSVFKGVVTISQPQEFAVLHQAESSNSRGLGLAMGIADVDEVYTEVYIQKLR